MTAKIDADAIVVLGCRLWPDGSPSPALRRRTELAVRLFREGVAPILLLSGGGLRPVSEAAAMRAVALAAGIPDAAILVEAASANTAENAFNSAALLRERGLRRRVVLVSHRQHLPRARMLFRLAGVEIVGTAGVAARSPAEAVAAAAYEIAAFPLAVLRGLCSRAG